MTAEHNFNKFSVNNFFQNFQGGCSLPATMPPKSASRYTGVAVFCLTVYVVGHILKSCVTSPPAAFLSMITLP